MFRFVPNLRSLAIGGWKGEQSCPEKLEEQEERRSQLSWSKSCSAGLHPNTPTAWCIAQTSLAISSFGFKVRPSRNKPRKPLERLMSATFIY
jgi:hypothetical protein